MITEVKTTTEILSEMIGVGVPLRVIRNLAYEMGESRAPLRGVYGGSKQVSEFAARQVTVIDEIIDSIVGRD